MFLDFLFQKKEGGLKTHTYPSTHSLLSLRQAPAPGTHIGYSASLIAHLEADHVKLAEIFTAIDQSFKKGHLSVVVTYLEEFRTEIQAHLLTENVRLYIYLEHALAHDANSHALIHEFRQEMNNIGKAILNFLSKYRELDRQPHLSTSFGDDLMAVGKMLIEHLQREESTLYPLYLPAY